MKFKHAWVGVWCALVTTVGCGQAEVTSASTVDESVESEPEQTYHVVGGEVSGLLGNGLVLLLNGEYELDVMVDSAFRFDEALLPTGSDYDVSVWVQPREPAQLCDVESGIGTIGRTDVSDIRVICRPRQYRVGGTLTGLRGSGLELSLNALWSLEPTADGDITFRDGFLDDGTSFEVVLVNQPESPSQTCSLSGGEGVINGADIVDMRVTCQTNRFYVGGNVTGLVGQGLTLSLNGVGALAVEENGTFRFEDLTVEDGRLFEVTIESQPSEPDQVCEISEGGGMVTAADVVDVVVTCAPPADVDGAGSGEADTDDMDTGDADEPEDPEDTDTLDSDPTDSDDAPS